MFRDIYMDNPPILSYVSSWTMRHTLKNFIEISLSVSEMNVHDHRDVGNLYVKIILVSHIMYKNVFCITFPFT